MTDAAPERMWISPWEPYFGYEASETEGRNWTGYVRADLASDAVRRAEALLEAESDALTTAQAEIKRLKESRQGMVDHAVEQFAHQLAMAQARIAELEAALRKRDQHGHDELCAAGLLRAGECTCGHAEAVRALEAKP